MDSNPESSTFDVVIVGGGPAGLAAGAEAAKRRISHVVLERGQLANTIFKYQKKKFVMAEPGKLPLRKELDLTFQPGSREEVLGGFAAGTKAAGTNIWLGPENEVSAIEGVKEDFRVRLKDGRTLACRRVVLAIGLQGNLRTFGVPGDDLPHVGYQLDDPEEHVDEQIVVVGVGDAGIENALALKDRNYVTVVNRFSDIDRAKGPNKSAVLSAAAAKEITYLVNTGVKRIEPGCVVLESPEGESKLAADLVIGRLGAMPPRKFLEDLGIRFPSPSPDAVPAVSESYESNVPGIYVIGALAGYPLIKHCLNQGCEVIEHIARQPNDPPVEPTDEPLLRQKLVALSGSVNEILDRIRRTVPLYASLTNIQLREFLGSEGGDVVRPKRGETIYRRGEGGHDFDAAESAGNGASRSAEERSGDDFYAILQGSVEVVAPSVDANADAIYVGSRRRASDASTITLGPGDFFGEGSLIAGRRRTATVIAGDNCVLLKTPRFAMTKLMKSSPEVKRAIDEVFILRKLQNAFTPAREDAAAIPIEEIRELARAAVVETFQQGEVVWDQDAAWFLPTSAWLAQGDAWLERGRTALAPGDEWLARGRAWLGVQRDLVSRQRALVEHRNDLSSGKRQPSPAEISAVAKQGRELRDAAEAWTQSGAAWLEEGEAALAGGSARLAPGASGPAAESWLREGKAWLARRDRSSGLHLIRRGSVTVSVVEGGHETVLAYLPAGSLIGEMALFTPDGLRSAAVRANVLTETIRLPADAVMPFIERHPDLRRAIDGLVTRRIEENVARSADLRSSDVVSFLVKAGAGEATDIILIDESLCIRCDNCEKACADTHGGVSRLAREAGPTFASVHVPTSCRHCENPKCMTDCPGACIHRHPTGEVYIDADQCIGCGNCAAYCPYNVIQIAERPARPATGIVGLLTGLLFGRRDHGAAGHDGGGGHQKKAIKCDLCYGLALRNGPGQTACASACPTGALRRVNPKPYFEEFLAK